MRVTLSSERENGMVQMNFNLVKCFYNFTFCPEQAEEKRKKKLEICRAAQRIIWSK